jgi:hypothetical protein
MSIGKRTSGAASISASRWSAAVNGIAVVAGACYLYATKVPQLPRNEAKISTGELRA